MASQSQKTKASSLRRVNAKLRIQSVNRVLSLMLTLFCGLKHDAHIYTNDGSKLSRNLSHESSQRTATEVQQQPAAPKPEPVSVRGVRPSQEEQGQSLGIGPA
jgi:hypothetical protein